VYTFLAPSVYIHIYVQRVPKKYTYFKRCYLCKIYIHFLAPSVYIHIYVQRVPKDVYTSEGAKKCIHILRDVIYVKCVYIFLAPSVYILYIHVRHNNYKYTLISGNKLKVCGHMFRPHCSHLQANLHRPSTFNVPTVWYPILCTIMIHMCVTNYC